MCFQNKHQVHRADADLSDLLQLVSKAFLEAAVATQWFDCPFLVEASNKCTSAWSFKNVRKIFSKYISKRHAGIAIKTAWHDSSVTKNGNMSLKTLAQTAVIIVFVIE